MAVGTISSPAAWYNGTPAPASWFQNAQDNVNAHAATQYIYLLPGSMSSISGDWTVSHAGGASQYVRMISSAASKDVMIDLSLPYRTSGTAGYKITDVSAVSVAGGGVNMTLKIWSTTIPSGISTQLGSTQSGTGTLTQSSLSAIGTDGVQLFALVTSGQANDTLYGVKVTFVMV